MAAYRRTSKRYRILLAVFLAACRTATLPPSGTAGDALPRRLVLALDGVDYRDMQTAQSRGLFRDFRPPGRLVSTFPSISDIAWHAIFGIQPPDGYQRVFYSLRQNDVLGDVLSAITPIEYERRMDVAFDTKFHHLGAYLISRPVARREIDTDVQKVLRSRGRQTIYIYNLGPDALQHTRGDIDDYLAHLDAKLIELQQRYRAQSGRALEILILSDHGHNRAATATFLPLVEGLQARGFVAAQSLRAGNEVVFSVDGVTTGFGVFCDPDSAARVSQVLATLDGVDVVTRMLSAREFEVRSDAGRAIIARSEQDGRSTYAYHAQVGDPLGLDSIVRRMRQDGAANDSGYADADAWVRYTAAARYPVAVVRIVHGHTAATRNPAPILVSIDDRYRIGLGAVSMANRLRPLGGTHGALSATNAVGVVFSNFQDTPDALAMSVRAQFGGFDDLKSPAQRESQLTITTADMLRADRFGAARWSQLPLSAPDTTPLLLLRLADRLLPLPADSLWFEVTITRTRDNRLIASTALPAKRWFAALDGHEYAVSAREVRAGGLEPGERYVVQLRADGIRRRADGSGRRWATTLVRASIRGARDGLPWTF
jgi:hypothetical protein